MTAIFSRCFKTSKACSAHKDVLTKSGCKMCVYCEIPSADKEAFWQEHSCEDIKFKEVTRLRITILGDAACETTSLLEAFNAKHYPYQAPYLQFKLLMFQDNPCELVFTNITGVDDYTNIRLRTVMYLGTDVTLLCYRVDSQESFANISNKWFPEIKRHCPKTPVILVGLKTDLSCTDETGHSGNKLDVKRKVVTVNEGKKLRNAIGASDFMECSAMKREGAQEVLESAIKATLEKRKKEELKRRLRRSIFCCTFC